MADPVRLSDVLASELARIQQLDSMCHCGHPLSQHAVGNECHAQPWGAFVADWGRCACRLYREAKCKP